METEMKTLLEKQGEAFEAFKGTMGEIQAEVKKLGSADGLLTEKLGKVEAALDKAVEGKAAIDAAIAAERKHVDDLEKRLNKEGIKGTGESAIRELEVKTFNRTIGALAKQRGQATVELDVKGYGEYKAAVEKYMRLGDRLMSAEEMKTMSVGSDPDGGYFVTPDTSGRVAKKLYETSPVRQYASVQVISTDALEGIEDLGEAGVGYAGEHTTSGDTTTPQVGKWKIPVFTLDTEPKATQQLLDDAEVDVEAWLADKVASKFARFENSEFVTGNANKIRGFIKGYTPAADDGTGVTWGTVGYVATGVDADFAASAKGDKLYDLMGLLKNEYLPGAAWFTRRSVITAIRKFKDGQNNYLWQPSLVAGTPETIMGYPVARMEDVPAIASASYSLAFGNLKEAYQIVDRQGIRVLRDPYTAKPYIKFYTTKRTGGGLVNFEAIKLMKFATS
jgi:HK97 family phage major capsid protein